MGSSPLVPGQFQGLPSTKTFKTMLDWPDLSLVVSALIIRREENRENPFPAARDIGVLLLVASKASRIV